MAPSAGRILLLGALFVLFVGATAQNGTTIQINVSLLNLFSCYADWCLALLCVVCSGKLEHSD